MTMYQPVLVTPPVVAPVSLAEVKQHCNAADFADDDALLAGYVAAATSHLDGWSGILGRCLVDQTWRQDYDDFRSCLRLRLGPATEVVSVKYIDTDAALQVVDPTQYSLHTDSLGPFVRFSNEYSFPSLNAVGPAVNVSYKAGAPVAGEGEAATAAVEPAIKQAILLLVEHWYDNRSAGVIGESIASLPFAVDALLAPFRRVSF